MIHGLRFSPSTLHWKFEEEIRFVIPSQIQPPILLACDSGRPTQLKTTNIIQPLKHNKKTGKECILHLRQPFNGLHTSMGSPSLMAKPNFEKLPEVQQGLVQFYPGEG